MSYLIDGYNFLFRLEGKPYSSFEKRREALIELLNEELSPFRVPMLLIFDSSEQVKDYAQKAVLPNLEVVYAPRGKTADCYIIELVEQSKRPKTLTVVTSDTGLGRQCAHLGSKVLTIDAFTALVQRRRQKPAEGKPGYKESSREIERLRKIFESRLKESGGSH